MSAATASGAIRSTIPARLDRLSWSAFHTRMVFGGIIELIFGIKAEGKSLEDVTKPLTATDEPASPASAVPGPA